MTEPAETEPEAETEPRPPEPTFADVMGPFALTALQRRRRPPTESEPNP